MTKADRHISQTTDDITSVVGNTILKNSRNRRINLPAGIAAFQTPASSRRATGLLHDHCSPAVRDLKFRDLKRQVLSVLQLQFDVGIEFGQWLFEGLVQ